MGNEEGRESKDVKKSKEGEDVKKSKESDPHNANIVSELSPQEGELWETQ